MWLGLLSPAAVGSASDTRIGRVSRQPARPVESRLSYPRALVTLAWSLLTYEGKNYFLRVQYLLGNFHGRKGVWILAAISSCGSMVILLLGFKYNTKNVLCVLRGGIICFSKLIFYLFFESFIQCILILHTLPQLLPNPPFPYSPLYPYNQGQLWVFTHTQSVLLMGLGSSLEYGWPTRGHIIEESWLLSFS